MTKEDVERKANHSIGVVEDMRQSLISKGQDVPVGLPFSAYADKIRAIEAGTSPMITLSNIITNGDFRDGFEGWRDYNATLDDGGVRITNTSTTPSIRLARYIRNLNKDNKYFVFIPLNVISVTNLQIGENSQFNWRRPSTNWDLGEQNFTHVYTPAEDDFTLDFGVGDGYSRLTFDAIIHSMSVINLTETFGAGNEPSQAVMDKVMADVDYFEGEIKIPESAFMEARMQTTRNANQFITGLLGG